MVATVLGREVGGGAEGVVRQVDLRSSVSGWSSGVRVRGVKRVGPHQLRIASLWVWCGGLQARKETRTFSAPKVFLCLRWQFRRYLVSTMNWGATGDLCARRKTKASPINGLHAIHVKRLETTMSCLPHALLGFMMIHGGGGGVRRGRRVRRGGKPLSLSRVAKFPPPDVK